MRRVIGGFALIGLAGCEGGAKADAPTWNGEVSGLVQNHCASCHSEGSIAPFRLDSYEMAAPMAAAMADATATRRMPPYLAAPGCAEYKDPAWLSEEEIATIAAWAAAGAPEGEEVSDVPAPERAESSLSRVDLELSMPLPYTPVQVPDEYRCFLLEWPETEPSFVTGIRAVPGEPEIVHHVIAFAAGPGDRAEYDALDAADPEPGYACYGGPGGSQLTTKWIGGWAPGNVSGDLPPGTGLPMEPGSVVILQLHYNLAQAEGLSDQTGIELMLAETVEKPAKVQPFTNIDWVMGSGMSIPAGESGVTHDFRMAFPRDATIYASNLHMHTLGTSGKIDVIRQDGDEECLLDIPRWDFHWQRSYPLAEPLQMSAGDEIRLSCTWDNPTDQDVQWGEGTGDEMCLGVFYMTAP